MIITKIEKQKKNHERSSVFLDDKFAFGIDDFDLYNLKLKVGMEISKNRLDEIKDTVLFSSAKEYAVSLVSRFSYTSKALKDKLKNRDYDDEIIDRTVAFLEDYHLIDDLDYAKRYINDALKIKHFGIQKIKYELSLKGINSDITETALAEFDVENLELEGILSLSKKRLNGNFEYKNIMKTKRYLISRGYTFEIIDKAINTILSEERE